MLDRIVTLLHQKGYRSMDSRQGGVLVRETEQDIFVITLSTFRPEVSVENYQSSGERIIFSLATKYHKPVHLLNLIATQDGMFSDEAMRFVERLQNVWFVTRDTGRIYIFENQPQQFDDLYEYLEQGMLQKKGATAFRLTFANTGIVALNIIYFITVIVINGGYSSVYDSDIMLRMGALNYDSFFSGRWYELITAVFLHFGIGHLFNNMVLLIYTGCQLEGIIGKWKYLALYMTTGIVGNITSLWYHHHVGEYVVSAGASGAIFGVIGALLVILYRNRTKSAETTPRRLFFLAFITIYYGLTTMGVDNAAHIGGFISGIIGGFLLSKVSQYGKLKEVS